MPTTTLNDLTAVNPVLQNMLVGYEQADSRFVADRVFPPVPVAATAPSGTYYIWAKKHFFLDDMQVRAYGGDYASLQTSLTTATYATLQYGADYKIADELRAANQTAMGLEQIAVRRLAQANMIRKERLFAAVAMASSVWGTDKTVSSKWSVFASSDPVGDVLTGLQTVSLNTGDRPNTLVFGEIVGKALQNHPDIINRIAYVREANAANINAALAGVMGIQNVWEARASYNTANEGQTASLSAIIDDDALLCRVEPGTDMFTASSGKCFVWAPGGGSGAVNSYRADANDADIVKLKHQLIYKVTASDTGYFFPDVVD